MPTIRKIRLLSLVASAAFAAACGESTAPDFGVALDTDAAAADYAAFDSVFATDGWAGFAALGARTPWSAAPAAIDAVAGLSRAPSGRQFAVQLARRLAAGAAGAPALAPVIDSYRGATFVYDADLGEYVVDPARTGAPSNGVRFIVYEVDLLGVPVGDEEIGHADLIDEGDDSAEDVALRLVVVTGDGTVLDYRTTVDLTLTQGAITVTGYLQGEHGLRLDFDIEAVGTQLLDHTTLDIQFDLGVDARDFRIEGSVHGIEDGPEGEGDVHLVVQHRDRSIRLEVSGSEGQVDGSVFLDDRLFATVSGDADDPTILSAEGEALTSGQIFVLLHVMDVVEDVFDFLEDLVDPVDEIVFLGLIL
ncbi:MAG: hypothetical protein AB7T31_03850 [Gemmatimonadales bacterium]